MTDEERLVDEFAHVLCVRRHGVPLQFRGEADRINLRVDAQGFIKQLEGRGVTLTIEPAPEPTYTLRMNRGQQKQVMRALHYIRSNEASLDHGECDDYLELWERVQMLEPDPEPTR